MWGRFKEIPSFIVAIISILTAALVLMTSAINYFATQHEFSIAKCEIEKQIDTLSIQDLNASLEIKYLDLRRDLLLFKGAKKGENTNLNSRISEIEKSMDEIRSKQKDNDQLIQNLKKEYGKCRK